MAARSKSEQVGRLPGVLEALAEARRIAIVRLVREQSFRPARPQAFSHGAAGNFTALAGDDERRCARHAAAWNQTALPVRREAFGELRTFLDIFWERPLSALNRKGKKDRHGGR
jgi:hypothetical protein